MSSYHPHPTLPLPGVYVTRYGDNTAIVSVHYNHLGQLIGRKMTGNNLNFDVFHS